MEIVNYQVIVQLKQFTDFLVILPSEDLGASKCFSYI